MALEGADQLPDFETIGRELITSVGKASDSLDAVEVLQVMYEVEESGDDVEDRIDEFFKQLDELPDHERFTYLLQQGLRHGISYQGTLFGVRVLISPVEEVPPAGPDTTGDREPRIPEPPINSGAEALEII